MMVSEKKKKKNVVSSIKHSKMGLLIEIYVDILIPLNSSFQYGAFQIVEFISLARPSMVSVCGAVTWTYFWT